MNIASIIASTKRITDKQIAIKRSALKTSDDSIKQETDAIHYLNKVKYLHTKMIGAKLR